jgi:hypothetical protein
VKRAVRSARGQSAVTNVPHGAVTEVKQRAVRSACGQSAVTNVPHAPRAVNVRVLPEANVRTIDQHACPPRG